MGRSRHVHARRQDRRRGHGGAGHPSGVGPRRGRAVSRLQLPLRLARREVWRRPGRTALVALLVAIPVAGMALAVTLIRSEADTPEEDWKQEYGLADATTFDRADPRVLPEGARAVSFQWTYLPMKTEAGRRADGEVTTLPLGDPLTEGIYELVAGRAA